MAYFLSDAKNGHEVAVEMDPGDGVRGPLSAPVHGSIMSGLIFSGRTPLSAEKTILLTDYFA